MDKKSAIARICCEEYDVNIALNLLLKEAAYGKKMRRRGVVHNFALDARRVYV